MAGWIDFLGWDRPWVCVWRSETAAVYFSVSLSVTMLCQGHFQPYYYPPLLFNTQPYYYPPLLFNTPSFSSHSLSAYTSSCFFFVWHSVFFPSISEYIVASGCECALSTCCNLDRCSLPLSLSFPPSLPSCPSLFLHPSCCRSVFLSPNKLRIFPLCDVKCGSRWGNGHLPFCGWTLGET